MKLPLQLGASRLGASRSLQQNEHLTGCPDMLLCKHLQLPAGLRVPPRMLLLEVLWRKKGQVWLILEGI